MHLTVFLHISNTLVHVHTSTFVKCFPTGCFLYTKQEQAASRYTYNLRETYKVDLHLASSTTSIIYLEHTHDESVITYSSMKWLTSGYWFGPIQKEDLQVSLCNMYNLMVGQNKKVLAALSRCQICKTSTTISFYFHYSLIYIYTIIRSWGINTPN